MDNRDPIDVVHFDIPRASDRGPRRGLVTKLKHHGLRGRLLGLIDYFLTDRVFRVRVRLGPLLVEFHRALTLDLSRL